MSVTIVRSPLPPLGPALAMHFTTKRFEGGAWTDCHCVCGWYFRAFDAKGLTSPARLDPFARLREHLAVAHDVEVLA